MEKWIAMDNLNCVQWIGSEWNVTEKGLVQNLGSRDISQAGPFGDMSDDIAVRDHQPKMTGFA
jgi:hypothetical protein